MKQNYDVLVVGGGPAGLVTAETTAMGGLRTLVIEREQEIGSPVHTSGATAPDTVERFGIPEELYHPVYELRFRGPEKEAVFSYDKPVLCIIDVRRTYQHLARQAETAGAEISTGTRATGVVTKGERVMGCTIERHGTVGEVAARIVVDATGYRAMISKEAGLHPGFSRFGVGAEYELIAPHCDQREAVMVVGSRYAPAGYAWVFPWGEGRVRVGVGVHHGDVRSNPRDHLDLFVREADQVGVDLSDHEVTEYHFGLVPAHGLPEHFVGDGIVAVGDSACQATLVVGEGIRIAMDAGRLAGEAIRQALHAGNEDRQALKDYEVGFRSRFERSLRIGHAVNRRLASFDDPEWDEKLEILAALPPRMIPDLLQSEFAIAKMIPMVLSRPRLWWRAARYAGRALAASVRG